MLRILIVEDHAAFRQALTYMLDHEPDFTVVAQASGLAEARAALQGVDVAIIDLQLADGSGLDLVRPLCDSNPHGAVLILTAGQDRGYYGRAVLAGAAGVMHKSAPINEIIRAVRRLGQGAALHATSELIELLWEADHQQEQKQASRVALGQLTIRERAVLQLLGEGLSDHQIGERLQLSPETARTHVMHIFGKFGVHSRLQAVVFGVRHGAITLASSDERPVAVRSDASGTSDSARLAPQSPPLPTAGRIAPRSTVSRWRPGLGRSRTWA